MIKTIPRVSTAHTNTHRPSLALSVLQPLSQRVMEPKGLLVSTLMIHTDPHDTHIYPTTIVNHKHPSNPAFEISYINNC